MYVKYQEGNRFFVTSVVFSSHSGMFIHQVYESVILRNVQKLPNSSCGNISVRKVGRNKHKLLTVTIITNFRL